MKTRIAAIAAISSLVLLSACQQAEKTDASEPQESAAMTVTDGHMGQAVGNLDNLSTAASLLASAGLDDILEGEAAYTLFLPSDSAFEAAGIEQMEALKSEEGRPELIAMLRNHIAPGALGDADIATAIENSEGTVTIANMNGGNLILGKGGKGGKGITIGSGGDDTASLSGNSVRASNGVIHILDGIIPPLG